MAAVAPRGASAQSVFWGGLPAGRYAVGYRVIDTVDVTRSFPDDHDKIGARPMRLYQWYPAARATGTPMSLRSLVLDEPARGGAYALVDPTALARALVRVRVGARGQSLTDADADRLLATPMVARRGASPARGRFPLVLLAPGSPSTMPVIAELLASRGYVVMGTDRKDLHSIQSLAFTPNPESIAAESQDLEFALGVARGMRTVDAMRVAAIGYSSSGISNLVFAMRSRATRAIVVFDGWEGGELAEPIVKTVPSFEPLALRGGYLDVESSDSSMKRLDVNATIDQLSRVNRWRIRFDDASHTDFASFAVALPDVASALRSRFVHAHALVASFIDSQLAAAPTLADFARGWSDSAGVHVRALPSSSTRPTIDEFYHLAEVDATAADSLALRLSRETPAVVPFTQQGLSRLALLLSSRRPRDAAIIRGIVARTFPDRR